MEVSGGQFRLALEAAPAGMVVVDEGGRIVLVNAHAERLFGYRREEMIGRPVELLVPERFRAFHPFRADVFADPGARTARGRRDLYGLRRDGTEIPIEIGLHPLATPDGRFVLSSIADIGDHKRGEREREELLLQLRTLNAELERRVEERTAELLAALREREVLLQEVHHRVKNNLQVISSLIGMQLRALGEGAGREALRECQARVQAIALIHEKLYQSKDYTRVVFSDYARSLAVEIFHATGISPENVSLELAIDEMSLAVGQAIPCGLIMNELITNALKHAFPGERTGTIRVTLTPGERGGVRLGVQDDGVGLPQGLDVLRSESVGLQLVRMLARQLDATIEIDGSRGTAFRLLIPRGE